MEQLKRELKQEKEKLKALGEEGKKIAQEVWIEKERVDQTTNESRLLDEEIAELVSISGGSCCHEFIESTVDKVTKTRTEI